jgi:TolB protein
MSEDKNYNSIGNTMNFLKYGFMIAIGFFIVACTHSQGKDFFSETLKIAYNVLLDEETGNYEIFLMNIDGTNSRNISNSNSVDWVYHSVAEKIYFISDRDTTKHLFFLYEMHWDGSQVRRVTDFAVENSWISSRKDGSELVISSPKDGQRHELYLIDLNGNELKRLTKNEYYDNDPYFSPDEKEIVFRSRRPKIDELWIINADGSNPRQLTSYPADDPSAGEYHYHAGPPFWEPNQNIISFMSRQNNNYSIFTIKPDGSDLRQLTSDAFDQGWHSWSPDGQLLVFDGKDQSGNYDIYIMKYDGSGLTRLTDHQQYEQAPVFIHSMQFTEQ